MIAKVTLPRHDAQLADSNGRVTREFYQWFLSVVDGLQGQITDLSSVVQGLVDISKSLGSPEGSTADIISVTQALAGKVDTSRTVTGAWSVRGGGPLSGDVILKLENDCQLPGEYMMYATDGNGKRGWQPQAIPSYVTTDNVAEGTTNLYFTNLRAENAVGGILANSANVTLTYAGGAITADLTDITPAAGGTLKKRTFDAKGRLSQESAATTSDLAEGTNLYYTDARADARITAQKAQPNGLASLDVNGQLDAGQLPALAITETFVVASQTAMLALTAQEGDVAVRTDENKSYILTASPASTLANWQELLTPTGAVTSFNGRTGAVVPASGDYTPAQVGAEPAVATGTTAQYWRGDKTWQDFATDVRGAVLTGLSTATNAAISATDSVLSAQGKLQAQISAIAIPQGYIDGLQMQWVSATALTVSSGAAYIPSLGGVLQAPSSIAKTGLVLSASTWYHVYLFDNAGTPDVEIVTTAPASPYNGTARTKTGDTSRRYLGSVKTDASGNLYKFKHSPQDTIWYEEYIAGTDFRVINGGVATASTSVDCSGLVPVAADVAKVYLVNTSTAAPLRLSNADGPLVPSAFLVNVTAGNVFHTDIILSAQSFTYAYNGSPGTGSALVSVAGYRYAR